MTKLFPDYIGKYRLTNSNGDIDTASSGFQYVIDTLSYIRAEVVEQKFYEIAPADYLPVDIGEAAWSDEIVQNLSFMQGGAFFEGDVDQQTETGRLANVNSGIDKIRMPVKTWAKGTGWTVMEIAKAAAASNWDVVAAKLKSLKKNWDLGIQEVAFLGHPLISTITGLLNDSEVNINTTLITTPISSMSETQFAALVKGLLAAYFSNSNSTAMPDTLVMPADDYLGLADPVSNTYPNIDKLTYLLQALQKITANPGFQILPLVYAQDDINSSRSITKNRYVLYRNDPETLKLSIPVDFTMLEADTSNKINWTQAAYGQYSGALINRKREVLYLDETAT